VIYLGTLSELLFPSLRLGYAVLPEDLVAPFAAARHLTDRQSPGLTQAIMTEFIIGGHFARHLKRMRAHYADRQAFLIEQIARRLGGLLEIRSVESGMYLTAWLPPGWDDRAVAAALAGVGVVTLPLSSLTLATARPPGPVLGYAGLGEGAIARAVERMAIVLESTTGLTLMTEAELHSDQSGRNLAGLTAESFAPMPDALAPPPFTPSARSRIRRHPERAHYDRESVFAILDAALLCHAGYVIEGRPYVTPTLFWRDGERLYWHGSSRAACCAPSARGSRCA
jgi:pyridoxamine 5'-phosphate oxidase-like protein